MLKSTNFWWQNEIVIFGSIFVFSLLTRKAEDIKHNKKNNHKWNHKTVAKN
jgi:hypothetical protein